MEQARDWVDYGLAVAVLAILVQLFMWAWGRHDRKLQAYITSAEHREGLIERHECRAAERYYRTLDAILTWARRVYGNGLGWRAFGTCLTLAVLYPILAALIGWVAVNQTAPGGLELFRDVPDWPGRLWRGAVGVLSLAVIVYADPRIIGFGEILRDRIEKRLDTSPHRLGSLTKAGWRPGGMAGRCRYRCPCPCRCRFRCRSPCLCRCLCRYRWQCRWWCLCRWQCLCRCRCRCRCR